MPPDDIYDRETLRLPGFGAIVSPDFFLYGFLCIGRDIYKLDANSDSRKAIANFSARSHFILRVGKAKPNSQDGPFGKMAGSLNKHSLDAEVGRANRNLLFVAFIGDDQLAIMSRIPPTLALDGSELGRRRTHER
ncbi:MAG: hypothetical protein WB682_13585, partial [Candidatus Dormiibacterota bacterium]